MLRAAIFDLDGLLIDSEPLWQRAEREQFATVGLHLGDADFLETTGMRIDAVVALRHRQHPWESPSVPELTARIVTRVVELIDAEGPTKPGAAHAIELCARAGLRLAVASSSPLRVIEGALRRIGLRDRFAEVLSAEDEAYGKPHPAVLLRTAARLGVEPTECVVLEDSVNGLIAAKAARMACVVVPERSDPRFVLADLALPSLEALDAGMLETLVARSR
jgi:sugar-phosphatase